MKIVIIGQWTYPKLTPRAFRTFELAKQFGKLGHHVVLYALTGSYNYDVIEKEYQIHIKNLGKSFLGLDNSEGKRNNNIIYRGIRKVIGNYDVFPGIEFLPMVKKALKHEGQIDMLITVAHPHVVHWATSLFINHKKVKLWIADCGDPYMGNPFVKHTTFFKYLEKKWCSSCDYITIPIEEGKNAYYSEFRNKIKIIPQGVDFSQFEMQEYIPNTIPTFIYAGICYKDLRDPTNFLKYLSSCRFDFRFIVYSKSLSFFEPYQEILKNKLVLHQYISRKELIKKLSAADFLINITNTSTVQQPSKLIDYGFAGRPILCITSDFSPEEELHFTQFVKKDYMFQYKVDNLSKYESKTVAMQFINLF